MFQQSKCSLLLPAHLVVGHVEGVERRREAPRVGEGLELVGGQVEVLQVHERVQLRRDRLEPVALQVQFPKAWTNKKW